MPKHVSDNKTINLKATVTGDTNRVKSVEFVPYINNEAQSPVPGKYNKSKATASYEPQLVEEGQTSYRLRFEVRVTTRGSGEAQASLPQQYTVWPGKVEITLTSTDNKAHKKAQLKIAGKSRQIGTTNNSGVWKGTVRAGKAFTVEGNPPWEIEPDPSQVGRKRTYKVKKESYEAAFFSPDVNSPNTDTKQYVNLEPTSGWTNEEPYGHTLRFEVGANGDAGKNPSDCKGLEGDTIHVKVVFTSKSGRNVPEPELKRTPVGKPTKTVAEKVTTYTGKVKLGGDRKATFTVELGHSGGDECKVSIGTTSSADDATLTFVTWRRVFYELVYPDLMTPDMKAISSSEHDHRDSIKNEVDARLAPTFVEYVKKGSHKFTPPSENVRPCEFLGQTGQRDQYIVGGQFGTPKPVTVNTDAKTITLLVADRTIGAQETNPITENPVIKDRVTTLKAKTSSGKTAFFYPLKVDVSSCKWTAHIPDPSKYQGGSGYTHPGLDPTTGIPVSGDVEEGWFSEGTENTATLTLPTGDGTAPGDLVAATESSTKCPIKITYKIYVCGSVNGTSASEARQTLQLKASRTDGAIAATICHELGHNMGMTIMAGKSGTPPGMTPAKHVDNGGSYYSDTAKQRKGLRDLGAGAHCAHGVSKSHRKDIKFKNKKTGTCIMFHTGSDADSRPNFCPACVSYICGRKLIDIKDRWHSRSAEDY